MRIRHLEVLHAILQTGSVSAAARLLAVSQPSVTKTLRHAELLAGYALFGRSGQRLVPTAELLTLAPLLDDVNASVDKLRRTSRNLRQMASSGAGFGAISLRIATVPALATSVLPAACSQLIAKHPALHLELATGDHRELTRRLFEREIDLGVAFNLLDHPAEHPLIERTELGRLQLVCAALPRLLGKFAKQTCISANALATMRLIELANRDPLGALYAQQAAVNDWPTAQITVQTYQVALELALLGHGVAVVDSASAARYAGRLTVLALEPASTFAVCAMTLKGAPSSQALQALLQALAGELKVIKLG